MKTVWRVFVYLKRYPWLALATLACAITGTLTVIIFPAVTKRIIDEVVHEQHPERLMPLVGLAALGTALVGPLFAFDGWITLSYMGGEVKQPSRNLPLAALASVGIVAALYLALNGAYLFVLGSRGVAGFETDLVPTSRRAWLRLRCRTAMMSMTSPRFVGPLLSMTS